MVAPRKSEARRAREETRSGGGRQAGLDSGAGQPPLLPSLRPPLISPPSSLSAALRVAPSAPRDGGLHLGCGSSTTASRQQPMPPAASCHSWRPPRRPLTHHPMAAAVPVPMPTGLFPSPPWPASPWRLLLCRRCCV
ncbi:hypothetical protein ZWY2020_050875 [Hordeum vulgare]|nr:hypothetical protein ZWY2020_050875 [Hordeum vulgare]